MKGKGKTWIYSNRQTERRYKREERRMDKEIQEANLGMITTFPGAVAGVVFLSAFALFTYIIAYIIYKAIF
jgi:hypothetical protein